jgi:DNA-binding IscR family transcriptional regulator
LTNISFVTIVVTDMAANSQFSIAVHILAMLAQSGEERVKSECLAGSVNTNAVVIRRLLCHLNEANLVVSQTGAAGGTRLVKDPGDITLAAVYKAVNCGEVFALHTNTPSQNCPVGKNIESVLGCIQKEIDRGIEARLAQYTLQDVLGMVEHA